MDAISKLGAIVLDECDMSGVYKLSDCLTSICSSIFNLYRTIAHYRRYCLFTIHYEFCVFSVTIINVDPSRCRFNIEYNDSMSATRLESVTLDDSNCDFDVIHGLMLGCLRSLDIENKIASGLAHVIKNPPRLGENEVYTENYDKIYKNKVARDLADGLCQTVGYSLCSKDDDNWIIYKEVWKGSGLNKR